MEINSIVIVSLTGPKEKIWGQLLGLNAAGATLRGLSVELFDDFVRQILAQEELAMAMAMVFYPMHRIERIALDEPSGPIPSLAGRFRQKVGISVEQYLGLETPRV